MAVHVADGGRFKTCVFQGQLHGAAHGFLFRAGGVLAVGVAAEANQFSVNMRASRQRVLQLFEHQHSATFTDHQAIAAAVVGARAGLRRIVFQAGGVQRIEDHSFGGAQFFCAAREHQRQAPELDCLIGVADALAAAGAGAGGRNQPARETKEDADICRRGVGHHAYIGIGIEPLGHRIEQHIAERLDLIGTAGGRATGHAHASVLDRLVTEQAGVLQGLLRRPHGQARDAAHAAQLFARPVSGHDEIVDRAGQARVQFGETVPLIHAPNAAAVGAKVGGDGVPVAAQGGHAGHAGDDNALHQHRPPFTASTWRVI